MNILDALGTFIGASWKWLIDSSPFLAVLVAVATAAIALRSIIQAAKDSDHRTRPVVAAEFQLSRESDSSMDLVIKNYGLSMARDLRVTFDRPVTRDVREHQLTSIPYSQARPASWSTIDKIATARFSTTHFTVA